jgi:hypothetical protein
MLVIKQKKHLKRLRTAQAQLYSILGNVKLQGPPAVGRGGGGLGTGRWNTGQGNYSGWYSDGGKHHCTFVQTY